VLRLASLYGRRVTRNCLVLIVEDYQDSRDMLAEFLALEGFDVAAAADGPEGLRLARELLPDAILLDLGLPKVDGFSLLRQLRADPTTARTTVIVISAYSGNDLHDRAIADGADMVLRKPCLPDEVVEALRTASSAANQGERREAQVKGPVRSV
jgi:two-component system cell cycle response regulator DivK